jgi:hypothetical protein
MVGSVGGDVEGSEAVVLGVLGVLAGPFGVVSAAQPASRHARRMRAYRVIPVWRFVGIGWFPSR